MGATVSIGGSHSAGASIELYSSRCSGQSGARVAWRKSRVLLRQTINRYACSSLLRSPTASGSPPCCFLCHSNNPLRDHFRGGSCLSPSSVGSPSPAAGLDHSLENPQVQHLRLRQQTSSSGLSRLADSAVFVVLPGVGLPRGTLLSASSLASLSIDLRRRGSIRRSSSQLLCPRVWKP